MNNRLNTPRQLRRHHSEAGASIIEVLVAALILSLGMLTLMRVQASSVQMAQFAQFRSEASRVGQTMADRVRANANNIAAYELDDAYGGNDAPIDVPDNCDAACDVDAARAQMTAIDLAEMRNQAREALPQGDIRIVVDDTGAVGTVVDIWVIWRQPAAEGDASLGGSGCPEGIANAASDQCQLTRFVL